MGYSVEAGLGVVDSRTVSRDKGYGKSGTPVNPGNVLKGD